MKTKAFTLIELLVVVAIIALLMAILIPALRLARDQAKALLCIHNLKTLSLSWLTYAEEHDGKLVGGHVGGKVNGYLIDWVDRETGTSPDPIERKKEGIRKGLLYPYVKNVNIYRCPADARRDIVYQQAFRSYSIAGGMNGEERPNRHLKTYDKIRNPSSKYVFVEEIDPRGYNTGSWIVYPTGNRWIDPLAIWHNDRSCLGFADGHAEKHQWIDRSTIEWAEQAVFDPDHFRFYLTVPAGEGADLRYMQMGYALRNN
jgi:prepilin-type N-terminal cleavage/methylation domain-containing protein